MNNSEISMARKSIFLIMLLKTLPIGLTNITQKAVLYYDLIAKLYISFRTTKLLQKMEFVRTDLMQVQKRKWKATWE